MRAPGGVATLARWAHSPPAHHADVRPHPHYAPDDNINNRLILWQGDISTLDADVITNMTDETLTECNPVSERIMYNAGPELKEEIISREHECRVGDVVVTSGYKLRCRHILHVVYPTYQDTYNAEAALHNCYKIALESGRSLGARWIALSAAPRYPADRAAHAMLRASRRFLECTSGVGVVVACARAGELGLAQALAPAYFPAPAPAPAPAPPPPSPPARIRIIHNPHEHNTDTAEDDTSVYEEESAGALARAMAGDTQRLLAPAPRRATIDTMHHDQYERLLRRARTEDLSEVSGIGCLYQSGVDRLGRPVVVFIGKWFPISDIDLDKALLYLIKLLDPIVRGDYVIAYFHTLASSANHPPFSWLKEVYTVLPYKYKKNLKAFYIIHPTFWTKMMTWWFLTFMAPAIKAKVHTLPGVEFLYSVMPRDQLEVPAFVTEYDMTINGLHYFQPDTNNT